MNCITLYRDCFKTVKSNREISQQGRSKTRNATGRYWTRFRRAHATPDSPWSLRIATPHFAHRRRHPRHRTQPTMTTGSVRTLRPSPELHPSSRGWGFKSGNQRPRRLTLPPVACCGPAPGFETAGQVRQARRWFERAPCALKWQTPPHWPGLSALLRGVRRLRQSVSLSLRSSYAGHASALILRGCATRSLGRSVVPREGIIRNHRRDDAT